MGKGGGGHTSRREEGMSPPNEKRRGQECPRLWNFYITFGVVYFGGSAGLVAGLAAPEGRAPVAPAGRVAEGAAGTPDCELYMSTIGLVISTEGPAQSTGPSGHCRDESMIR